MMNPTSDPLPTSNGNEVNVDDQDSQIPFAQLKHQFQDILFNPKYTEGADQFLKSSNNSVSISTSLTDSSSMTLHYEDYKGHHAVFSAEGIKSLRHIAEMLSSRNDLKDCVQMYIEHRKDVVNMVHMRLLKKLNVQTVCAFMYWDELSEKTQRWIQVAKICIGTIFGIEKCFYEQIFGDCGTAEGAASDGFIYIIREAAANILTFPDSLLASCRSPQRPDILLPLYHELTTLIPHLMVIFEQDSCSAKAICTFATGIMFRLKQHMTKILSATERHVLGELSMTPTPRGAIHPLTEYVIHYVDLISVHKKSLIDLVASPHGSNDRDPPEEDSLEKDEGLISLNYHLTQVIEFLLYNLKYKSKFYGEKSLGHFFMMNNIHSVAEKIKSLRDMEEIISNNFLTKLNEKVELARTDYLKITWDEIFHLLGDEGPKQYLNFSCIPGKSTRAVKKKIKTFNRMFEDVYQIQVNLTVPDQQLREKLHECILANLIPAYNHLLGQFSCRREKVKHPKRYIKYSVKDLETKVLDMFQCQVWKI